MDTDTSQYRELQDTPAPMESASRSSHMQPFCDAGKEREGTHPHSLATVCHKACDLSPLQAHSDMTPYLASCQVPQMILCWEANLESVWMKQQELGRM